jgi:hypothetical protein
MKAVVLAAVLCVCFVAALSADVKLPLKPLWPDAFSSTVAVRRTREFRPSFFRWFYDSQQMKDRIDGIVRFQDEFYFATLYFDHPKAMMYSVFYQESTAVCFTSKINTTLPKPNFNNLNYVGKALIDLTPSYHWFVEDRLRDLTFQVYDRQDNREVLRIDFDNGRRERAESWTFLELDIGSQGTEIFQVPANILAQCTPMPGPSPSDDLLSF